MAGSNRRIWWKCDKGPNHEWGAVLRSRTSEGRGCPYCHVLPRSKIELQLAYEIDNANPKGVCRHLQQLHRRKHRWFPRVWSRWIWAFSGGERKVNHHLGEHQVSTVLMLRFHANKEWIRLFVF